MHRIGFVLLIFTLLACKKSVPVQSKETGKINAYEEDISGVRPVFPMVQEEKQVVVAEKKLEPVSGELKSDNELIQANILKMVARNESISEAQGYRIQLFTGNNRAEFEAARGYILQFFPELELYESFSQPTYKIKAGDFLRKMDADRYFATLSTRFNTAKIITDKIDVKKSFTIK